VVTVVLELSDQACMHSSVGRLSRVSRHVGNGRLANSERCQKEEGFWTGGRSHGRRGGEVVGAQSV
jgi:hypothetical protein